MTLDNDVLSLVSNSASDTQEVFNTIITAKVWKYNTYGTAIGSYTLRTALYSGDPSIAIQAPCGGVDVARPADIDSMSVVLGSEEKIKIDVPTLKDIEDNVASTCNALFEIDEFDEN